MHPILEDIQKRYWRSMPAAHVAFHEAGHAVISHALGLTPISASVVPTDNSEGHVHFVHLGDWRREAIVSLAGGIAELAFRNCGLSQLGDSEDMEEVHTLVRDNGGDLAQLIHETADLVREHYQKIETLACALVWAGELKTTDLWKFL